MQIFVKVLTGQTITLEVEPDSYIGTDVKEKIEAHPWANIPPYCHTSCVAGR